jgi:hypothetical protein
MKRECAFKTVFLALSLLVCGCADRDTHRVVASLPAIESILTDLTAHTSICVVNPVPRDISLAEIESFCRDHDSMLDSFSRCDAVFDLRSIIPQDGVYRALRKKNIRIVETDCATPLDPDITPVPLIKTDAATLPYVWLSASNCMKMAEIAAKDLEKLYPGDSAEIRDNLASLKKRYLSLKSMYESKFAEVKNFQAAAMTRDFDYFLADISFYTPFRFPSDNASWTDAMKSDFATMVKTGQITTIIHRWKPAGLDSGKVEIAVLSVGDPAMKSFDNGLYGLLERNYSTLLQAFIK